MRKRDPTTRLATWITSLWATQALACDPTVESEQPCPESNRPTLVGAQYTFIRQRQSRLTSPYQGPLSLDPNGDTQQTHTIGLYLGWALTSWAQVYLDTEKFMGAGVSNSVGLAGLTNELQVTPDFQYIRNPAYNRDRGPVKFWAIRFHLEL
jgi:hypothetical protein